MIFSAAHHAVHELPVCRTADFQPRREVADRAARALVHMGGCHPRLSRQTGLTTFIVEPLLDVLGDSMDRRPDQRMVGCNHHLASKDLLAVAKLHQTPREIKMLAKLCLRGILVSVELKRFRGRYLLPWRSSRESSVFLHDVLEAQEISNALSNISTPQRPLCADALHDAPSRPRFLLSEDFDPDRIEAEMRGGVLTLTLPRAPEAQPKRIAVKGA